MPSIKWIRLAALFISLTHTLSGCAAVAIAQPSAMHVDAGASPEMIRTLGADQEFSDLPSAKVALRAYHMRAREPFRILALLGGGAEGAFGAGALVGLARSGVRPQFSVVTGVSTGALIAPFAFLGPQWDSQLTEAYTSGRLEHLLQPRGLGVIFGSSAYRGSPLEHVVEHYLTDALISAVASEAGSGRLLLVATTNVSTGETVVWDLGSIAMNGGDQAKALLRDVLVASASVPGLFPPVIIRVRKGGALITETHIDGTAASPFLVPAGFTPNARGDAPSSSPAGIYVIVDGHLSEEPRSVKLRFRPILSRGISVGLVYMMRTTLQLTATKAERDGATLEYSAIPVAYGPLASFDFRASKMRALFEYGYDCARAGRFWTPSTRATSGESDYRGGTDPGRCPADDEFIERFALR